MNSANKYNREIIGLDGNKTILDVYRVLVAFNITDPEIQHAAKKILCAGLRDKGNKDQDISEAILSLQKFQERKIQESHIYGIGHVSDSSVMSLDEAFGSQK